MQTREAGHLYDGQLTSAGTVVKLLIKQLS